jgi:hypothetical protein
LYYGFSGNLQEKVSQEGLVVSRDSLLSAYDKFCTNKQFSVFALLSAGATDVSISAYDYLPADALRGLSDLLSGAHLPGGSGGWVDHAGLSGKPPYTLFKGIDTVREAHFKSQDTYTTYHAWESMLD